MPSAGYSGRTLVDKLGIKPGALVVALGAPPTYGSLLGRLPPDVEIRSRLPASASFIHQFARRRAELTAAFPRLALALSDTGTLWVSWPKKASGVATDLDENIVRDLGLEQGLVDIKVCAVDEVWSGLKFVRRIKNRGR
jgi:hypothetical protein